MGKICVIAIWCLVAIHLKADERLRLFAESGSQITVRGENTLHNWVISGSDIGGWIEFTSGVFDQVNETLLKGSAAARGQVVIPVRSLRNHEGLTAWIHQLLKESVHPQITFSFQGARLKKIRTGKELLYRLNAQGALVVAGVTHDLSILIDVVPLGGQRFRLTGKTGLKISSFSIEPPVLQISSGKGSANPPIKYRDEIEVSFDWNVGPKSENAPRD